MHLLNLLNNLTNEEEVKYFGSSDVISNKHIPIHIEIIKEKINETL